MLFRLKRSGMVRLWWMPLLVGSWMLGCQQPAQYVEPKARAGDIQDVPPPPKEISKLRDEAREAMQKKDYARAQTLLNKLIKLDPGYGPAWHELGLAYYHKGDLYNAAINFEAAGRIIRDRPEPCYDLGLVLETGGRYESAMAAYERALSRRSDHLESMENLARLRLKLGMRDRETLGLLQASREREHRPDWSEWIIKRIREFGEIAETRPEDTPVEAGPPSTAPATEPAETPTLE